MNTKSMVWSNKNSVKLWQKTTLQHQSALKSHILLYGPFLWKEWEWLQRLLNTKNCKYLISTHTPLNTEISERRGQRRVSIRYFLRLFCFAQYSYFLIRIWSVFSSSSYFCHGKLRNCLILFNMNAGNLNIVSKVWKSAWLMEIGQYHSNSHEWQQGTCKTTTDQSHYCPFQQSFWNR